MPREFFHYPCEVQSMFMNAAAKVVAAQLTADGMGSTTARVSADPAGSILAMACDLADAYCKLNQAEVEPVANEPVGFAKGYTPTY